MTENPLYCLDRLEALGADLQVFAKGDSPLAKYLGTMCVDPGVKLYDPNGLTKAYTMLGGFVMPYDPGGKDQLVADIATALTVKKNAGDNADTIFIMGHENCAYAGILYNSLLGTADQYPIRKKFVEALTKDQELHDMLENSVKKAQARGDDEKLIIRALTEMMLIESLRNLRAYIVDNDGDTIADYMEGKVKDVPRLSIMPIFTLAHGQAANNADVLYFNPENFSFVRLAQIASTKNQNGRTIDQILDMAREKFVERMESGDYSHIILSQKKHDENNNNTRQLPPRDAGAKSCA